jgi:hypothetical protein
MLQIVFNGSVELFVPIAEHGSMPHILGEEGLT